MRKSLAILPLFAVAYALAGASAALAGPQPKPANPDPQPSANYLASHGYNPNAAAFMGAKPKDYTERENPTPKSRAAIKAFLHAAVPIDEAIAKAQRRSGGRAVGARFELDYDQPLYQVRAIANRKLWVYDIDADTGRIIESSKTPAKRLDREDRREIRAVRQAKSGLMHAVSLAETKSNGRVLDAEMDVGGRPPYFAVQTLRHGHMRTLDVSSRTGGTI